MDATNRRPQLPALSYLDVDKVKREEEAYQSRNMCGSQLLPAVTAASPYPQGPPPPYSQPPPSISQANTYTNAQSGVRSPPESRRTSGDEQDAKHVPRQSLPSISEALGVESQTSYAASTPAPPPASTNPSHQVLAASSSPKRSYGMEPPPLPPSSYGSNGAYSSYPPPRQETNAQPTYHSHEAHRAAYTSERPSLHLQTSQPPQPQHPSYNYPTTTSPGYEHPQPHSAATTGSSHAPYGYTPYPPRYAQPTSSTGGSSGPIYQPSLSYPAPLTPSTSWKSDSGRDGRPAEYSSSVKRHLDMYDLEGALNEIAQNSSILLDFSRRYGDRMHQTVRTGPPLSSLPGIVELDDMISKSRVQMDAVAKIREVVLAHQAAYEEQRHSAKTFAADIPPTPDQQSDDAELKAGFAGGEPKKRRGRAAPPGRCHSCNRAETPEWRRGPDGARTLCNACGLHYAKLTRKQQGTNKAASNGTSNLRPKET
ncbi:hypothetical protein D0863_05726 [Hortaea werneckii]|uniref:GATA-type domain-containing protein n=1 Tax=Hortaea werneckii TaxID=91943 RepID=A0A3M7E1T0_HORWE|nr:hypothetical protein D0863_05726 [Hortaea werneckii]